MKATDDVVKFLQDIQPFKGLDQVQLKQLADDFGVRTFAGKETIFYQGDTTSHLYVIRRGQVKLVTIEESGRETCLRILGGGDILGELSALDREPRSASARALTQCSILKMEQGAFLHHVARNMNLAQAVIQLLAQKLRWTTHFSHTLSQYGAAGRLAHLLIDYKEKFGTEIAKNRIYEINLALNQTELASMVGARREWVNKLLQSWLKKGLITYSRGSITILDLPTFKEERDGQLFFVD